jgi:hypothetical protein
VNKNVVFAGAVLIRPLLSIKGLEKIIKVINYRVAIAKDKTLQDSY